MSTMNPIHRVTKTVRLATAKRDTANRVGRRFMAVVMGKPPVEFLSPGHESMSHQLAHEPKPGSRQQEVSTLRYQPNAAIPTGPVGRPTGSVSCRLATRQIQPWSSISPCENSSDCQSLRLRAKFSDLKRETWQCATDTLRLDLLPMTVA